MNRPSSRVWVATLTVAVAAVLAVAAGCVSSARGGPQAVAPPVEKPLFEFHSGFWLNLHQRLHYAATARRPAAGPEAPAWTAAVDFYRGRFAEHGGMGLLFDDELVALNRRLAALGSAPALAGVEPELAAHLEAAAGVVRPEWGEQDRANRAWIAALEPALERHGQALRGELSAAYQASWPAAPIRADVSRWAGPVGAYTVLDPPHVTISSGDPSYAGEAALEMIFHEASHALIEPISEKLAAEAERLGRRPPRDLWHALLFYSTGEIVKRRLGPEYVPYAARYGLWQRAWPDFEPALRRDWQPYLDGKVDLDTAVRALLAGLMGGG